MSLTVAVVAAALASAHSPAVASAVEVTPRSLPAGNLIVGYSPDCNETQVVQAARDGVNVLIWFAINLAANGTIQHGLNFTCIGLVESTLRADNLTTSHLISVGGWDAPHPDTSLTGAQWFSAWDAWNKAAAVAAGGAGDVGLFDGVDWDLEGNDDLSSEWNHFTPDCVNLVGEFSQAAKRAGEDRVRDVIGWR